MTTALSRDLEIRAARASDAPALAKLMVRGNSTYRAWAPRFWQPPAFERTQSQWNLRLHESDRRTRIVIDPDDNVVALVSWASGARARRRGN